MGKIVAGNKMPDFVFDTPYAKNCKLSDVVKRVKGKTALVFLRYYGCTLCQLDIIDFTNGYKDVEVAGAQLLVALQSDPAKLATKLGENKPPFDIVCDPDQKLYKMLNIEPAKSKETLGDATSMPKLARARAAGLKHGDYEGNELQLPAVFIVDSDMTVAYAHYGRIATDVPTIEELVKLLK